MRILLVEDDQLIATPLTKALNDQHYVVDHAIDGLKGWELAESFHYDLILLDVLLPQLDGLSFCERLRSQGNQTLILLLTAQDTSTNKVQGLDAGADDYVVKPFDLQELLARIRALLRRGGSALPPLLTWGNLNLDPSTCEVTWESQQLRLTPKEYSLLELLLRNPQRTYSSSALIDHLWSLETPPAEETIRSHVKGLRHKLKTAGVTEDPIETVYGIGYRLRKAERTKTPDESQGLPKPSAAPKEAEASDLWQDIRDQLSQRATVIEQASLALQNNQLSPALRLSAEQNAHKLSGSMGMFGSDEGSRLAQKIETLLGSDVQPDQIQAFCQLVQALRQELHLLNAKQPPDLLVDEDAPDAEPSSFNAAASPIVRDFKDLCVANHAQSLQDLDQSLELAKQETRSFSLAILNLDSPHQTLDRQHFQIKNQVIHHCRELLRTQFRATDVISYCGDETFVIGMGNTPHSIATQRLTDVLKTLHEQALTSESAQPFEVAFSAGIAGYPQDGTDLQTLYSSAIQALEHAKAEGSNQVWVLEPKVGNARRR